jgi:hypothetical protein
VTVPGPQDPTTAYLVHRGLLAGMVLSFLLATGYLIFHMLPDIQHWVASAIQSVHDEWNSWM